MSWCCCVSMEDSLCWFNWSDLPDDIKIEILCRLPKNSLFKLKSVSKSFNFLISIFCIPKLYPWWSTSSVTGYLYPWSYPKLSSNSYMRYLPFNGEDIVPPSMSTDADAYANYTDEFVQSYSKLLPFEHDALDFKDCSNGLLLMVNSNVVPLQYFVCNPATKQTIPIPVNPHHTEVEPRTLPQTKPLFAALAFDPSISPIYTIVCFNRFVAVTASVSDPPKFDIFSSYTGKWVSRQVHLCPQLYGFKLGVRAYFLNGSLNLLSAAGYLLQLKLKLDNVISVQSLKLPHPLDGGYKSVGVIHASKGRLYYSNQDTSTLNVWSLQDEAQWIIKYSISIDVLINHPEGYILTIFRDCPTFNSFGLHPTSDDVIFIGNLWTIYAYNPKLDEISVVFQVSKASCINHGSDLLYPYSPCPLILDDFHAEPSNNPILASFYVSSPSRSFAPIFGENVAPVVDSFAAIQCCSFGSGIVIYGYEYWV